MKKYNSQNPGGFTLLIVLGVIGFLLILLTGIFKVVSLELKDTRNMDYYLKSKGAAEAGQELALLKLKEEKFGYHGDVPYNPSSAPEDESLILAKDPINSVNYHQNKDVFLGYYIDSETSDYSGILEKGDFQVIPLFVKNDGGSYKTAQPSVNITSGIANNFIWNIIGEEAQTDADGEVLLDSNSNPITNPIGISGNNTFLASQEFQIKNLGGACAEGFCDEKFFSVEDISIQDFLDRSTNSYLTIFNKGNADINYEIATGNSGDIFTKPITTVLSQAKIGEIKQNIELTIDNAQYFDVLKYSLYDAE